MQGQRVHSGLQGVLPAPLPAPVRRHFAGRGALARAEGLPVGDAVQEHLENARRRRVGPVFRPVLGADIEGIFPVPGDFHGRFRILRERGADAVGQQVTRPHLQHELLLDGPVPPVAEPCRQREHGIVFSDHGCMTIKSHQMYEKNGSAAIPRTTFEGRERRKRRNRVQTEFF